MTQEEFDNSFITNQDLTRIMGVSHSYFDRPREQLEFPEPIKVGRTILWHRQAIKNHWMLQERGVEL